MHNKFIRNWRWRWLLCHRSRCAGDLISLFSDQHVDRSLHALYLSTSARGCRSKAASILGRVLFVSSAFSNGSRPSLNNEAPGPKSAVCLLTIERTPLPSRLTKG